MFQKGASLSRQKLNRFNVGFNKSAFEQVIPSSAKLKVFLMDKASSPQFYRDELEMKGDPIEIPFQPGISIFKTKISKSEHVLGDPLFDCAMYTENNIVYENMLRMHGNWFIISK